MANINYPRLPEHPEFSDYNSKITMYYITLAEIAKLQKENRKRVKELDELRKKYFDGALLKKEWVELIEKKKGEN